MIDVTALLVIDAQLACILHEGNEIQGKSGKQGRTIARRPIAIAMGQRGSFEIDSQTFSDFGQGRNVTARYFESPLHILILTLFPRGLSRLHAICSLGFAEPKLGRRNEPAAETHMALLPGNANKKDEVLPMPCEKECPRTTNSASIGTGLEPDWRTKGISTRVVAGLTTGHCASAATRAAPDFGFAVMPVTDASTAFARRGYDGRLCSGDEIHRVIRVSRDAEFCRPGITAQIPCTPAKRPAGGSDGSSYR